MIKILGRIPNEVTLAISGGVDSMAVYHMLAIKGNREVTPVFVNHHSDYCAASQAFLENYFQEMGRELIVLEIEGQKEPRQSFQQFWREERYKLLTQFPYVLTAHHLDDVAETWLFSCLHGTPKIIPFQRNNVYRHFLSTSKQDFIAWCQKYSVPWFEDLSNQDCKYNRNRIRHDILPEVLKVNPGFKNMLYKRVVAKFNTEFP